MGWAIQHQDLVQLSVVLIKIDVAVDLLEMKDLDRVEMTNDLP